MQATAASKRPSPATHPLETARIRLEEAFVRLEQVVEGRIERETQRVQAASQLATVRLEKEYRTLKEEKEKLGHLLQAAEATKENVRQTAQKAAAKLDSSINAMHSLFGE